MNVRSYPDETWQVNGDAGNFTLLYIDFAGCGERADRAIANARHS
jgi:hypothetical protein